MHSNRRRGAHRRAPLGRVMPLRYRAHHEMRTSESAEPPGVAQGRRASAARRASKGVRVKREMQYAGRHRSTACASPQGVGEGSDQEATDPDRVRNDRVEMRERQPLRTSDARAIRELSGQRRPTWRSRFAPPAATICARSSRQPSASPWTAAASIAARFRTPSMGHDFHRNRQ
jgi:hypothetical protein